MNNINFKLIKIKLLKVEIKRLRKLQKKILIDYERIRQLKKQQINIKKILTNF